MEYISSILLRKCQLEDSALMTIIIIMIIIITSTLFSCS